MVNKQDQQEIAGQIVKSCPASQPLFCFDATSFDMTFSISQALILSIVTSLFFALSQFYFQSDVTPGKEIVSTFTLNAIMIFGFFLMAKLAQKILLKLQAAATRFLTTDLYCPDWIKIYRDGIYVGEIDFGTKTEKIYFWPFESFEGVGVIYNSFTDVLKSADAIVPAAQNPSFQFITGSHIILKKKSGQKNLICPHRTITYIKYHPANIANKISNGKFSFKKRITKANEIANKVGLPYLGIFQIENARYK